MASVRLARRPATPRPSTGLASAALCELALRFHQAATEDELAAAVAAGLESLGLWHALYLAGASPRQLKLRASAFPSALRFRGAIDLDGQARWRRLLAQPRLPEGVRDLPFLQAPRELAEEPYPLLETLEASAWAVLPLRFSERLLGCLLVLGSALSPADLAQLTTLAGHLALALERLATGRDQFARAVEGPAQVAATMLGAAGSAIAARRTTLSVRRETLLQLIGLVQGSGAAVLEIVEARQLRRLASHGAVPALPAERLLPLACQVAERGQPGAAVLSGDGAAVAETPMALLVAPFERSGAWPCVVLVARPGGRSFTAAEQSLAEALLQHASAMLRRAREESRLRQRARALERRNRIISAVNTIPRALNDHAQLETRMRVVLEALVGLRVADGAALLLPSQPQAPYPPRITVGLPDELAAALSAWRPDQLSSQVRDRKIVVLSQAEEVARVLGVPRLPVAEIRRWVLAPLEHGGHVDGLLLLASNHPGRLVDRNLVSSIAQHIAVSMSHGRLFVAQREAADLSTMLLEVARSLAAQVDLEHVLSTISELTPRLIAATRGMLWRYDEERSALLPWHASGMDDEQLAGFHAVLFESGDVPCLDAMLRDGQALALDQEAGSPLPAWMASFFDIRSMVLAPLICKGRPLGVIAVDQPGRRMAFSQRDIAIVEGVASHAALALDNARLYEQTVRRADQLGSLYETGRALSASLAISELLSIIAESAARLVGASWSTLSLVDEQTKLLVPVHHWPAGSELPPPSVYEGLEMARRAVVDGQSVVLERGELVLVAGRDLPPIGSVASVPLLSKGRVVGALDVFSRDLAVFGAEEVRLLEAFAGQAATAIENGRLFQQLTDGKRTWEETFDAITDGICVRNQKCEILRANQALARILGTRVGDLIGTRLCEQLPELQETCHVCARDPGWDDEQPVEATELRPSGLEPMLLSLRDYPVREGEQAVVRWVTVIEDVTMERRMQDALIRSEKMRALGEMASGIAHDFNNLLAAILARAELSLLEETCADGQRAFETIRRAALDGVATVRRIQEYSRVRQDVVGSSLDVNEVVESAVELARHKWKDGPQRAGIRMELALDLHAVPPVSGDPAELREVLMNLVFNAVDAMPKGGEITISTRVIGDRVMVSVADTGRGMTEDLQRRIFDPFFTTKGDKGSGLGLSVSYGIIARHGGDIVVQSHPGAGSVFTVRLPLATALPGEAALSAEAMVSPAPPSTILLVDDDQNVLESVADLLRRDGHTVSARTSPSEALADFEAGQYDYVITDLGMPEMNGWDLARQLKAMAPAVPIILLTGWRSELTNEHAEARGVSAVLAKPCTLADLRRVMSAHPPGPAAKVASGQPGLRSLAVLVVDDQPQFAEALAGRLRLEAHRVTVASTGQEGLHLLQQQRFDLAMVDLRLPDMSGADVAATIRAQAASPFVVLMTGLAVSCDDRVLAQAADALLPKPWKSEELARVLERASAR